MRNFLIPLALVSALVAGAVQSQTIMHLSIADLPIGADALLQGYGCSDSRCAPGWEEEQIRRALQDARLAEMIERLKNGLPSDCTAAICITEKLELFTTFVNTENFAVKQCEAAICTTIEDPIVPKWLNWEIIRFNTENPFDGCKDAMCVAPQGRVAGPDDESDDELKRLQEAEARAKAERELARQERLAAAKARAEAEAARKAAKQAAEDARNARQEQLRSRAEARAAAQARAAEAKLDATVEAVTQAQEDALAQREAARTAGRAADIQRMIDSDAALLRAEQAILAAETRAEIAEARALEAENRFRLQADSAADAFRMFAVELGMFPYLSDFMMACRGAGTGCIEPTEVSTDSAPTNRKPD